ncbi:MAG: N-acetylglucosamine-6-phosphate deacetylase, partial [Mycobacterium sp.]|nr:N-acetylglucosamine-6-phosphate deacetylase [Mycobacterium sp.]
MPLIAAGTIVLEQQVHRPGWVETSRDRILGCGPGSPPRPADVELPDAVVVPGFVDMHVHGGGGGSYTDASSADILCA